MGQITVSTDGFNPESCEVTVGETIDFYASGSAPIEVRVCDGTKLFDGDDGACFQVPSGGTSRTVSASAIPGRSYALEVVSRALKGGPHTGTRGTINVGSVKTKKPHPQHHD